VTHYVPVERGAGRGAPPAPAAGACPRMPGRAELSLLHVLRVYSRPVSATGKATAASLPLSSKLLCVVYASIAVAALVLTWSQNTTYLHAGVARFYTDFLADIKVTPASRSIACDILLFFLAAAILMVIEARKHGVRFVWVYILAGMYIDISVAFPLFLIARELRMGKSDEQRVRAVDTILLALLSTALVALAIFIDIG
jgi:hypothetical protein